jgi:TonB-dependent SusC/RagA subfamily outer membrane receptor
MPDNRLLTALFAVTVCGAPLAAQEGVSCSGPGAVFGVTSYQCASCSFTHGDRTMKIYTSFQTEPIVLTTAKESALQPGDVVEAVNGEPITTAAGAEQFTSPRGGKANVTVRRGGSRVQLSAVPLKCDGAPGGLPPSAPLNSPLVVVDGVVVSDLNQVPNGSIESVDVLKGPAAALLYGSRATNGVIVISTKRSPGTTTLRTPPSAAATNEPLIVVDGVVIPNTSEADASVSAGGRRFGFAIGCVPSCTRARTADGADYYMFDGYPPIVALTPGGAAERAGIQVGDLISHIDGKSILSEEGATRFFRNKTETMKITIVRNRQPIGYVLKAR